MPDQIVKLQRTGAVARITLSRPELLNAIDQALARQLADVVAALADDPSVHAVVLTGEGRGFCAGGDMKAAAAAFAAGGDLQHLFAHVLDGLHAAVAGIAGAPMPFIAAINGPASGAGVGLAAACDLRLADETASFKPAYASIGLTPDAGWTALVPRVIGLAKTRELLLTDPTLTAHEAAAIGLVDEVCPTGTVVARAHELAERLAAFPPSALAGMKQLLFGADLAAQLELERERVIAQAGSDEFRARAAAFAARSGAR